MLFAGGSVWLERWLGSGSVVRSRVVGGLLWGTFAIGGALLALLALPIAPVNSAVWNVVSEINTELKEEIGWPELVETVAEIYHRLPPEEQTQTGILTGNYGEAGAINLSRYFFESCERAGLNTNSYGVRNEETKDHPVILLCRGLRRPWPELWKRLRSFG